MELIRIYKRVELEVYEFVFEECDEFYYCLVYRGWKVFDFSRYYISSNDDPEIQVKDVRKAVWNKYLEYCSDPFFEIEYKKFRSSF